MTRDEFWTLVHWTFIGVGLAVVLILLAVLVLP